MRKFLPLIAFFAFGLAWLPVQGQRYLTEVFTNVDVTPNVEYGQNLTVITGMPGLDTLYFDLYAPAGDTASERPVVLISHTGSFLPTPLNGQATGERVDSNVVELCKLFARRGFVAAAYTYRQGWNPASSVQEVRTGTLLNAAYRGIQDTRNLVRFFKDHVAQGNANRIDSSNIIVGGIGTGGYLSLGAASLDKYAEINLAKFIDPVSGNSYVDTSLSGNLWGTNQRPLNLPNFPTYSSSFDFCFNLGGALGDSTWLEAGDVPTVSFHVPSDPFAPYDFGAVIVPTTGDFVVNVSGSKGVQRRANGFGNNNAFILGGGLTDSYSTAANVNNGGLDGLMPFLRPTPESGPWEWWDSTFWAGVPHPTGGTFTSVGLMSNPDMSKTKAVTYLDSVINYVAPRIVCALGLAACPSVGVEDKLSSGAVKVFPNPSSDYFMIRSEIAGNRIERIELTDLQGRLIREEAVNGFDHRVERNGLTSGIYFVRVFTDEGWISKKLLIE